MILYDSVYDLRSQDNAQMATFLLLFLDHFTIQKCSIITKLIAQAL